MQNKEHTFYLFFSHGFLLCFLSLCNTRASHASERHTWDLWKVTSPSMVDGRCVSFHEFAVVNLLYYIRVQREEKMFLMLKGLWTVRLITAS